MPTDSDTSGKIHAQYDHVKSGTSEDLAEASLELNSRHYPHGVAFGQDFDSPRPHTHIHTPAQTLILVI